jgi:hypothetical protein
MKTAIIIVGIIVVSYAILFIASYFTNGISI